MKTLLLLLIGATAGLVRVQGQEIFVCDIPTSGCSNGMFNQAACECECISPFCHDMNGDCTNPSNNCGGNPWADCTRGVNCPWWVNPLKAESCTTGPSVPLGLWEIYNSKTACCNSKFAYSTTCDVKPPETAPTKFPTLAAPEGDDFEVIPIKFDIQGLSDDIRMSDLKVEMTTVLKRILVRLADRINGLKITNVEEKVVLVRDLKKALRLRKLEQDVTVYFNVYVVRDDNKKFGPIIINEIRDSYDEVLEQIQAFTDTSYFGAGNLDMSMNWCTSRNGKFELCAKNDPTPPPVPAMGPSLVLQSAAPPSDEGGLAGWAIALIIIFVLLIVACIGYFVFITFIKEGGHGSREIHNNIYLDEKSHASGYSSRRGSDDKSRASGYTSRRSHRAGGSVVSSKSRTSRVTQSRQLVLAVAEEIGSYNGDDDGSLTINTRGTSGTKHTHGSRRTHGTKGSQGTRYTHDTRQTQGRKQRLSRDPTMYEDGQAVKPDPDSDALVVINEDDEEGSGRHFMEDPPMKPKRDPTMFVEGDYSAEDPPLKPKLDPSMYLDGQQDPSMYVEGQQDPSMYVEGEAGKEPTHYSEASAEEMYTDEKKTENGGKRFGMEGIEEEEEYDRFGFKHNSNYTENMEDAAESNARMSRDPTYYETGANPSSTDGSASCHTQDPSVVSSKSAKQSKRSDGNGRKSGKARGETNLRKSLQSNWGSMPDVTDIHTKEVPKSTTKSHRQTKSFYN